MDSRWAESKEDGRQRSAEARKMKDSRRVEEANQNHKDLELKERKKSEEKRNLDEEVLQVQEDIKYFYR